MFRNIISILTPSERRGAAQAAAAIVASTLLDLAGLAALLPALYWILERNGHSKALFFCGIAFILFAIKGWMGIYLARYVDGFCMKVYRRMSLYVYASYYRRGLAFLKRTSSSRLAFEVNSNCMTFSTGVLLPLMTMCGDILLLSVSVVALSVWSPITAGVLVISFLPVVIIWNRLIRKRLNTLGEKEKKERQSQWSRTISTYDGYCEIETTGSFPRFQDDFSKRLRRISDLHSQTHTLMMVPSLLSELCAVVGLTFMVVAGGSDVRMMIGVFALAAFRLLPSLRQMMGSVSRLRNSEHVVGVISEAIGESTDCTENVGIVKNKIRLSDSIAVKNLHFRYETDEDLFRGLDLTVHKGEYLGIRGESGNGKTTLVQLIMGFLTPSVGTIAADGISMKDMDIPDWISRIGYVPQDVFLFDTSVIDNITMHREGIDPALLSEVIDRLGLDEISRRNLEHSQDSDDCVISLSGGERQRVGIARAVATLPDILILDEATSSLDPESERRVVDFLLDLHRLNPDMTIISISHRSSTLSRCDRIINL